MVFDPECSPCSPSDRRVETQLPSIQFPTAFHAFHAFLSLNWTLKTVWRCFQIYAILFVETLATQPMFLNEFASILDAFIHVSTHPRMRHFGFAAG